MRNIVLVRPLLAISAVGLLAAACSWYPFSSPKSDLGTAAQAAKIAGADDAASRNSPIILGPRPAKGEPAKGENVMASAPGAKTAPSAPVALTAKPATAPATQVATVSAVKPAPAESKSSLEAATTPLMAGPAKTATAQGQTAKTSTTRQTLRTTPTGAVAGVPAAPRSDVLLTKVPAVGTAIHLASYREIGAAERGWTILRHDYKELAALRPLYVAVDVPGKGHVLRLYGTGENTAALKGICTEMKSQGAYCAANIAF